MMHVTNNRLFLNYILVVANLCKLQFFANILVCTVLIDLVTTKPDFAEIAIHLRFMMMHG